MKRKKKLDELYDTLKRELIDITIYNLVDSTEKIHIKYDPNYQRNYIWDNTKAINLIETILINGVIPPMTVIKVGEEIEIIDGRQRYETLLNFKNNKFPLKEFGLQKLKDLHGKYYKDLPPNVKDIFNEYKMKMIMYTVNNSISVSQEDLEFIKRDLFRRYNYGMTALTKSEVARAKYLYDFLTSELVTLFKNNVDFYNKCSDVLLSKAQKNKNDDREKQNMLLVTIREVLIMPYIPIIGEKSVKVGASVFDKYYSTFITSLSQKETIEKLEEFKKIFNKLYLIKEKLKDSNSGLQDNTLFFKSTYWMLSILFKVDADKFYNFNVNQFYHYIENGGESYFDNFKNITSASIESRHSYMKKYLSEELKLYVDGYLETIKENKKAIIYKTNLKLSSDENWNGISKYKPVITVKDTLSISEIIKLINENRFIIRPAYQRTEVKSRKKASKIIESIMLGVKLPPIYLYSIRGENGLPKYIVLDGQQRLISILKFMGEFIKDENYNYIETYKKNYALTGLKELSDLNTKVYKEGENSINQFKREPIKKYEFEVIKINQQGNEDFDSVDMFLRLNQNPCPININSFEMWNSFDITDTLNQIKRIAKYRLFKQSGNNMKEEELVTTLAYMDYQGINIKNVNDFFTIYKYMENKDKQDEHYEIKMSITNKENITNFLEELKPDSNDEKDFLISVDSVNNFKDKLEILSEGDENVLIKICNPHLTIARKINKKDFYIIWLILEELDKHVVITYRKEILKDLENIFKFMKNIPPEKDADSFIKYIKNIIDDYSRYSSKTL